MNTLKSDMSNGHKRHSCLDQITLNSYFLNKNKFTKDLDFGFLARNDDAVV